MPARNPDLLISAEPVALGEGEAHLDVLRLDALAQASEAGSAVPPRPAASACGGAASTRAD